jgi:hypothetical protein
VICRSTASLGCATSLMARAIIDFRFLAQTTGAAKYPRTKRPERANRISQTSWVVFTTASNCVGQPVRARDPESAVEHAGTAPPNRSKSLFGRPRAESCWRGLPESACASANSGWQNLGPRLQPATDSGGRWPGPTFSVGHRLTLQWGIKTQRLLSEGRCRGTENLSHRA